MKELLELRRKLKAKKPTYLRTDAHKKVKLGKKYRKPKGYQNKMRLNKKSYRKTVRIGYGSPTAVKGLSRDGLQIINVNSVNDLAKIDPKTSCAEIGSTVGGRKKIDILTKAIELKIKVSYIKDAQKEIERLKSKLTERKAKQKSLDEKKKARDKKKQKESIDKKVEEPEKTDEEKKDKEKKELDKTLIQAQ